MNRSTAGRGAHAAAASPPHIPRREPAKARKQRAAAIAERLAEAYPSAHCSLDFKTPFQLVIATILSAQCTDKRVNMVTPALFRRWPTAGRMARATQRQMEEAVRTTGFFRAKARNILGCCQALVDRHGGEVPRTLAELVQLPGVGRKTANVVLGSGFSQVEGVVVDTHVGRISRRLGLTRQTDAVRAERDLMTVLPRDHWIGFSHRVIEHGRTVCTARSPACDRCVLADLCPRIGVVAKRR